MPPKKKSLSVSIRAFSLIGSFGFTMGACILAGYYLGSYIDNRLGTEPWFMLLFLIAFIAGAFIKFIQSVQEASSSEEKQKK